MTLNISLVTASGIHQWADFRLLDATSKRSVSDSSAKLVLEVQVGAERGLKKLRSSALSMLFVPSTDP